MLLIWLLLPAVSAIIDCRSACDLCQMDKDPATIYITCTLCRKCHWALNPRRMMELQLPNRNNLLVEGQVLTDKQLKELKNAELKEFKEAMKDYGWKPEDLVDKRIKDKDEDCIPPTDNCLAEWESEEHHSRLTLKGKTTAKCPGLHHTTCPPVPKTTRKCPPIKPCKKKHGVDKPPENEATEPDSKTSPDSPALRKLRKRIMRQLANLDQTEPQDDGCPHQPDCSDEKSDETENEKLVNKDRIIAPPPLTTSTTSSTERPCQDKKHKESTSTPCVPCMPQCPLPCLPQYPLPAPFALPAPLAFPPPMGLPSFLTGQIPKEAMEALMTLKTTTGSKPQQTITHKTTTQKEEEEKEVTPSSAESSEELVLKEEETTKATTKHDYLYLYVGIPKNVKNIRKG